MASFKPYWPELRSVSQLHKAFVGPYYRSGLSVLRYVRSKLEETGLYVDLDLLADPDEPRDLCGMLLRREARLCAA